MNKQRTGLTKAGLFGVGALTIAGLCLGGGVAANATTSSDNAGIASTTTVASSGTSSTYTVVATRLTAGEDAVVKLTSTTSEKQVRTYTTVDSHGRVSYTFTATKAGTYTVKFYADGESTTKTITVGTAYAKATVSADDTDDRKTTIEGTGVAGATLQVKIYGPDDELITTKTVTVDSSGDWSTTTKQAKEDGEYTVVVRYVATTAHFSAKNYSTTFERE